MKRLAGRRSLRVADTAAQLESSLSQAIAFLDKRQRPDGEFQTFAATNQSLRANCHPDSSLFVTALVLYAIGWSDDLRVSPMIGRALDFLAAQMKGAGLWSYWSTRNARANYLPPDLDDTCCISFLMRKYARPFPSNKALILGNRNPQGLYYTWLAARPNALSNSVSNQVRVQIRQVSDPDVELVLSLSGTLDIIDCAVNANVLLFLGQIPETQSAIDHLVKTVRDDGGQACSTFYPDPLTFYYFLSRAYANGVSALNETQGPIIARLESIQSDNGSFGNVLLTALAACTLLNFRVKSIALDRAVGNLLGRQNADGSWARHAMFLGPAPYYGSEELTTALGVEALSRYRGLFYQHTISP